MLSENELRLAREKETELDRAIGDTWQAPKSEHPAIAAAALILAAVEVVFAIRFHSYRESSLPLVIGAIAAAVLAGLSLLFPRFGAEMVSQDYLRRCWRNGFPISKWEEHAHQIREQPQRYSIAAFCGLAAGSVIAFAAYLARLF